MDTPAAHIDLALPRVSLFTMGAKPGTYYYYPAVEAREDKLRSGLEIVNQVRYHLLLPGCETTEHYLRIMEDTRRRLTALKHTNLAVPSIQAIRDKVQHGFPTLCLSPRGSVRDTIQHTPLYAADAYRS
jgi:hypothetical protein